MSSSQPTPSSSPKKRRHEEVDTKEADQTTAEPLKEVDPRLVDLVVAEIARREEQDLDEADEADVIAEKEENAEYLVFDAKAAAAITNANAALTAEEMSLLKKIKKAATAGGRATFSRGVSVRTVVRLERRGFKFTGHCWEQVSW